ncbi:MAG: HpcH/HpaI aldolase/citrate lyase family protein [Oscillospiraceae bacterium]
MTDIKSRLKNGENIFGTMINIVDHPDIVKIFKSCGFDYFIVDCEHGCMSYDKVSALVGLAKEMDIAALVRIPKADRESILRYMEMGADGLMLPNTDTADQARELVRYAKYAPIGERGISMMRGHNRYIPVESPVDYMREANENTILIVQIESSVSISNIEEILSVEGIDIAFMGPSDLCQSLGILGHLDSPIYVEAVEKVIAASQKLGKACGTQGMNPEALQIWVDKGMRFNLYSNEVSMLMREGKTAMKILKK